MAGRQDRKGANEGITFVGTLLLGGKTATGIEVPPAVVERLAAGKKPAVRVTIGEHSYRSTLAVRDGKFMLPVSAENRAAIGVEAGDVVEIRLEVDTEPREITPPADFAAALDAEPKARDTFESLSYSVKQWHVLSIEDAKSPQTRQRRIAKSIGTLREGRSR